MPHEFQTHALSVSTFAASSRALCTTFQLLHTYFAGSDFKPFLLLHKRYDQVALLNFGEELIQQFLETPCIFSNWWYEFIQKRQSTSLLCGPDSLAVVQQLAEMSEFHNVATVARTAFIRRQ